MAWGKSNSRRVISQRNLKRSAESWSERGLLSGDGARLVGILLPDILQIVYNGKAGWL